ncbi:uncharacterized protein CLUP02_15160 [Colletotrichum lupini]|uniref:Uncharacterized protein n=1 Tax=Colletotrichum lupini TaxID=145971 RepID=A0A9Q8T5J0_9PEZI|nr:uncharacterized protein CLUP02_15160 [Colletotrichum lupini]UQC89629.1 hypothetical protein CLUP02_15160 [Colletotrichum lupini]
MSAVNLPSRSVKPGHQPRDPAFPGGRHRTRLVKAILKRPTTNKTGADPRICFYSLTELHGASASGQARAEVKPTFVPLPRWNESRPSGRMRYASGRSNPAPGPVRAFYNENDRSTFDVGYKDVTLAPRGPRNGRQHGNSNFSLATYHPAPTHVLYFQNGYCVKMTMRIWANNIMIYSDQKWCIFQQTPSVVVDGRAVRFLPLNGWKRMLAHGPT